MLLSNEKILITLYISFEKRHENNIVNFKERHSLTYLIFVKLWVLIDIVILLHLISGMFISEMF